MTATTQSKVRLRRAAPDTDLPEAGTLESGAVDPVLSGDVLLAEARMLMAGRQWKAACSLVEEYRALGAAQAANQEADELLVVAAAYARKKVVRDAALARLSSTVPDASAWESIAAAQLAGNKLLDADRSARQALELSPDSAAAWGALATSYAGLGWFNEAADCLDTCESHGGISPLARWQLGQSINRWAMGRNHAPLVALLATMLIGNVFLGLAVAATTPLAVREPRVRRLDARFKTSA
ncbi:MAG: hypothetical protein O3C27_07230, partial [Actinomycetota bacterium]|nr:hypothetical protein [Actinomycetota bacterium]